jgi:hypothetical protein
LLRASKRQVVYPIPEEHPVTSTVLLPFILMVKDND